MPFKDNGDYFDHRKVYGKGKHDGYTEGYSAGKSDDGFGTGALVGGLLAGIGGLVTGVLASGSESSSSRYMCGKCGYSYKGSSVPKRCPNCDKKTAKHWYIT